MNKILILASLITLLFVGAAKADHRYYRYEVCVERPVRTVVVERTVVPRTVVVERTVVPRTVVVEKPVVRTVVVERPTVVVPRTVVVPVVPYYYYDGFYLRIR